MRKQELKLCEERKIKEAKEDEDRKKIEEREAEEKRKGLKLSVWHVKSKNARITRSI